MHRIDTSTAVEAEPAPAAAGTPGYFQNGNPATGTPATYLNADWCNAVQEEIAGLIETYLGAGSLDKADRTQLTQAVAAAIAAENLGTAAQRDIGTAAGNVPEVLAETGYLDPAILPPVSFDAFRKGLYLNDLMTAALEGQPRQMPGGWVDPLSDLSFVETGSSSNYSHDSGGSFLVSDSGVNATIVWKSQEATAVPARGYILALLEPVGAEQLIDPSTHTPIGTLTDNAGLAAAFNGVTDSTAANCARSVANVSNGTVGLTFVGGGKRIAGGTYFGSNDFGIGSNTGGTIYLEGTENDVDWVELGSVVVPSLNGPQEVSITSSDAVTVFSGIRFRGVVSVNELLCAEAQFTEVLAVGSYTYGVDLLIDMTVNDGGVWEALDLTVLFADPAGRDVVYGDVDFATGGDQTIRMRLRTANTKRCRVHGIRPDVE